MSLRYLRQSIRNWDEFGHVKVPLWFDLGSAFLFFVIGGSMIISLLVVGLMSRPWVMLAIIPILLGIHNFWTEDPGREAMRRLRYLANPVLFGYITHQTMFSHLIGEMEIKDHALAEKNFRDLDPDGIVHLEIEQYTYDDRNFSIRFVDEAAAVAFKMRYGDDLVLLDAE